MPERRLNTLSTLCAVVCIAACAGTPARQPQTEMLDSSVTRDLERLRSATAAYRDIAAAQAVGYPTATPPCLSSPAGGMGHHFVNRSHVDDKLDLEHPEILLYGPASAGGKPKLLGVEYIIPYRILPPESQPPRIFGQDLKRSEELRLWYLHVWAWEQNASGLFADWNPAVKC